MPALADRLSQGECVAIDFRKLINDQMMLKGLNKNQLHKLVDGKVSRNALYTFLAGENDMLSKNIAVILEALENYKKSKA